ncbi:MAG: hypothetical protein HYS23_07390 [Geobacter sp.]|nr:hypothetical protein [Geobacter sp.]
MLLPKTLKNEDGLALIVSLVFLLITLVIAGVVSQTTISEIIFSRKEAREKMVLAMADAGSKDAISWLNSQAAPPEGGLAKINGKSAFYKDDNTISGTTTYSWWSGVTPPTVTGWSSYKFLDAPNTTTDVYRYYPSTAAGWTNYVVEGNARYRYYIEHLPSDYSDSTGTATAQSIKVGNKYDATGGNAYRMYRITSVGSTSDDSIKRCIEMNYAVKY